MGTYTKVFRNHSEYTQYVNSGTMVRPNVSICKAEDDVHFNAGNDVTIEYKIEVYEEGSSPFPPINEGGGIKGAVKSSDYPYGELLTAVTFNSAEELMDFTFPNDLNYYYTCGDIYISDTSGGGKAVKSSASGDAGKGYVITFFDIDEEDYNYPGEYVESYVFNVYSNESINDEIGNINPRATQYIVNVMTTYLQEHGTLKCIKYYNEPIGEGGLA